MLERKEIGLSKDFCNTRATNSYALSHVRNALVGKCRTVGLLEMRRRFTRGLRKFFSKRHARLESGAAI